MSVRDDPFHPAPATVQPTKTGLGSAHIVRQFGNDAAHGDILQPPSVGEAKDVLDIVDELLHQLFTSPARSKRLKAAREGKG